MIKYDNIKEIEGYPKLALGRAEDLRSFKFHKLQPLYRTNPLTSSQSCAFWLCKCDCGNYYVTRASSLKNGSTQSCGCYNKEAMSQRSFVNIAGQRFGRLIALSPEKERAKGGYRRWTCQCDCGNITSVKYTHLVRNLTQSCGCLQKEQIQQLGKEFLIDLTGQKFGQLTVLKRDDTKPSGQHTYWICKCSCGNITSVSRPALVDKKTISCGCYGSSKGEQTIVDLLKQKNILFKQEVSFEDLRDKRKLRFDFGIYNNFNQLLYLIEYDGIQHFQITGGRGTLEQLQSTQNHDKIKNQYCKNNNIPLIRIPYTHLNDLCIEDLLLESSNFIIN